jgi:2-(1,2-epoxy-1,2-dihydrophenyl)acetyl-CoA isomerase
VLIMTEPPVLKSIDDGVATVTLNRPGAMNALDSALKSALLAALVAVARDEAIRVVVLTGAGRAFSAGQDLREHAQGLAAGDLDRLWSTLPEHYIPIAEALHTMPKPVLAAVNGIAAGAGAAIALLADLRIVREDAGLNLAFSGIGLACDTGSSWTLPRLVGSARAIDLLFRPRTVSASEALELGLVTEVVPRDAFADRVTDVARQLAAGPTLAYAAIRRAVSYAASRPLAEALVFEGEMMRLTGGTEDHRRAVEAFLAKQPASFSGR